VIRDVFPVAHAIPGRIRLKLGRGCPPSELNVAADRLLGMSGVTRLHINAAARSVTVEYRPDVVGPDELLDAPSRGTTRAYRNLQFAIQERWLAPVVAQEVWELVTDFARVQPFADDTIDDAINQADRWSVKVAGVSGTVSLVERVPGSRLVLAVSGPLVLEATVSLKEKGPHQTEVCASVIQYSDQSGLAQGILFCAVERQLRERLKAYLLALCAACLPERPVELVPLPVEAKMPRTSQPV
jgi:hypothetical protein